MPTGIPRPQRSPHLSGLKESVRRVLDLDDDTAVMISQLACTEPGCPPIETVVAVLPQDAPARRWTLHSTVDEITTDDLSALLTTHPEGA